MIDLILILFVAAVFYSGFYVGKKYGSLKSAFEDLLKMFGK